MDGDASGGRHGTAGAAPGTGGASAQASVDALVLTPRAFWSVFALAWVAYGALYLSVSIAMGDDLGQALAGCLIGVVAAGVPAVVVALGRERLLEARATLGRFVGRQFLVGFVYAATAAAIASALYWAAPVRPTAEMPSDPLALFAAWFVNSLFLFGVLLGFLMWTDALQRVHDSRVLAAREAALRAQAEAKAVRAQFNPHFVFNTLHSLMLLVRAEPDTAERAIEDVAALIRYASTLQRREIDQVALSKELSFARRYVSLEQLRLGGRLRVEWHTARDLDDVLVPAFSLQTLLENAIRHGIAEKPEGGTVRIGVSADEGGLRMSVADDGVGADPGTVGSNGGSGLTLLGRRLETVYAGEASLAWRTGRGDGFEATVRVPLRRAGPEEAAP